MKIDSSYYPRFIVSVCFYRNDVGSDNTRSSVARRLSTVAASQQMCRKIGIQITVHETVNCEIETGVQVC